MKRDLGLYCDDIIAAIKKIEEYIHGFTLPQFLKDQKTQDAVTRNIEIIGEAAKKIPDELKQKYPKVMWREAAAMRDVLIHDYPDVIPTVVWNTVTSDIPKFKEQILTVIKSEGFSLAKLDRK